MNPSFIFTTLCVLICSTRIAMANTRVEAIDDYIRPFIENERLNRNSSRWDGTGNGGYLFRYRIDVTGDGRDELLVLTSLASFSNYGDWKVFDVSPTGELRPYEGIITLVSGPIWLAKTGNSTELYCEWAAEFDSDEGLKNRLVPESMIRHLVTRIGFDYPKIKEAELRVTEAEALSLKTGGTDVKPKLEVILLADYLTNQNATWQEVPAWICNSNDYFQRPEDVARIRELNSFTPQVAMSLLDAAQGDIEASSSPTLPTPKQVRTPKVNSTSLPKTPDATPPASTQNDKPTSSTPWSMIVVLLMVAIGLLLFLLKKAKVIGL